MEKAFKFRLYPTPEQEQLIQRTFGCCRFVWNYYLAKRIELYKTEGKSMSYYDCTADLTQLKRQVDYLWLNEVDVHSLHLALKALNEAYIYFFRQKTKNSQKPNLPRFKSKKNSRKSYRTRETLDNIRINQDSIRLPKLGLVPCVVHRLIEGRILNATVSQTPSGKYFVSVCCTDVEIEQLPSTNAAVGLDLGITDFAVSSNGQHFPNHKYLAKSEKKLKRLQGQLSRKQKGSKNREKAKIKLARMYEKVTNQRKDTLHKLSTSLVKNYDVICLETLAPKNMMKNHRMAKAIGDASWGEFVRQLKYKTAWQHKALVQIDRFYPSSQLCSCCGYQNANTKDLSVRKWVCPECRTEHDRDENAAKNILSEGLRLLA